MRQTNLNGAYYPRIFGIFSSTHPLLPFPPVAASVCQMDADVVVPVPPCSRHHHVPLFPPSQASGWRQAARAGVVSRWGWGKEQWTPRDERPRDFGTWTAGDPTFVAPIADLAPDTLKCPGPERSEHL